MSVRATPPRQATPEQRGQEQDSGWLTFASLLLVLLGLINLVEGIAAVSRAHFFAAHPHYVFGDLKVWGWIVLCLGVVQMLAGAGVMVQNQLARWVGVGIFGLDALAQLLMMPSYPFWSLCIFAVDILGMYGLLAHGNRPATA